MLAIEMPKSSWSYVLAVLSFLVNASIDEELFGNVIKSFQSFTSTVGILGLNSQRDAFLGGLCKACVPNPSSGFSVDTNPQILSTSINFRTAPILLHERNVVSLKALLSVAQKLTPVLEEKAWYLILDTLQIADGLVSLGKMGRKDNSSMQLGAELLKDGRQRANTFTQPPLGGGGGGLDNLFVSVQSSIKKFFETSKTMEDASFHEFTKALCRMAKEFCTSPNNLNISKDSMKVADEKSFAIARIHDLAVLNVNRLILSKPMWVATATPTVPFQVWDVIVGQLVDIAHHPNCPPSIRSQLCLAMSEVLTAAIQNGDLTDSTVEQNILAPLRNLMVGNNSISGGGGGVDDDEKDDSNIDVTRLPWFLDVQKSGLEILYRLLQAAGQNIKLGWGLIFSVVRTVVGGGAKARRQAGMEAKALSDAGFINPSDSGVGDPAANSANVAKYASLVRVAFPCLQLICTDFLSLLNPAMLYECIETLSCFGFQADDLNISLTSIGLLWSVSDFVLTNRQKMEKEEADKSEGDLTASVSARAVSTSRTFIKSPSVDRLLEEGLTKKSLDTLWMFLLSNFSQLCSDQRPEVRNSANQTLFRTIGMNGQRLTIDAWEECIWNVLFPLLDRVKTSSELAEDRERMER